MNKAELKTNYEKAANDYLFLFCKKHDFEFEPDGWVGSDVGGIVCICDCYVDMRTIIDDIEMEAPEPEFQKWYDYCLELGMLGVTSTPNFRSWIKGCPRKSEAEIEEIRQAHAKVEECKKELEKLLNQKPY